MCYLKIFLIFSLSRTLSKLCSSIRWSMMLYCWLTLPFSQIRDLVKKPISKPIAKTNRVRNPLVIKRRGLLDGMQIFMHFVVLLSNLASLASAVRWSSSYAIPRKNTFRILLTLSAAVGYQYLIYTDHLRHKFRCSSVNKTYCHESSILWCPVMDTCCTCSPLDKIDFVST